ncbi:MAG: coproporphyrinogen dehydrogenase HemZ [Defluviitaleaceae bacterium]|nr:coproporphyrinogen dehydrogenase HemZ [Defluviitaleaceae bacterium]
MYCILKGHDFVNEIQTMTQVFYPNEKFIRVASVPEDGITAVSELSGGVCRSLIFHDGDLKAQYQMPADDAQGVKKCMFLCLTAEEGHAPDWGILTGIRPSKLVHSMREQGRSDDEIIRHFADEFYVTRRKAELCLRVADAERAVIERESGEFCVYIGIPFCPSRCLYCSFPSQPIGKSPDIVDDYLAALEKELESRRNDDTFEGLPDAIYIGGGTPASLDVPRLERLLKVVDRVFPSRAEYTVEAGRPDTIDRDKLRLLKAHNVTRLSINPQTMHDRTLETIGRGHTRAQFLKAFELARAEGHNNINVDLILGLPGETAADVKNSLEAVLALRPENLTAHILAVKRASRLKEELHSHKLARDGIEEMLRITELTAREAGMHPYYMYRQKNMLGNFENVGYSLPGFDCIYNVMIMTERQTIHAFGAGAITKTVGETIERTFNLKMAEDYIKRINDMKESR